MGVLADLEASHNAVKDRNVKLDVDSMLLVIQWKSDFLTNTLYVIFCIFFFWRNTQEAIYWFLYAGHQVGYNDDDTFALLYGVFAARASSIRSALSIAEQYFRDITEFQLMVADCQQTYFKIRYQMLEPVIRSTIEELKRFCFRFQKFCEEIMIGNFIKHFPF